MAASVVPLTSAPLPSGLGTGFLLPLDVGTPPQRHLVRIETLSSEGLLLAYCGAAPCFNASASSSLQPGSVGQPIVGQGNANIWTDEVALAVSGGGAPPSSVPVPMGLRSPSWTPPAGAVGVLGVGRGPIAGGGIAMTWERLVAPHGSVATLDLNPAGDSRLSLAPPNRTSRTQWSSVRPRQALELDFVQPSVCGASLLGDGEVLWPAYVDTTVACLRLPPDMFDALFSWLVIADCTSPPPLVPIGSGASGGPPCRVAARQEANLPMLSFRLAQHAPMLTLPLAALLLPPDGPDNATRPLCIERIEPTAEPDFASAASGSATAASSYTTTAGGGVSSPLTPPAILGTAVLEHFETHLDMRPGGWRVGLTPKAQPVAGAVRAAARGVACAARSQCIGQQKYVAAHNRCQAPDCSSFFLTHDHVEGVCTWHMSFRIFLALLLGALGVCELLLQTLHVQLPSLYARVAAATALASANS